MTTHATIHEHPDVSFFGSTPSARIRARMFHLASDVLRAHLEATSAPKAGSSTDLEAEGAEGSAPLASAGLASVVFKSSWEAFKQVGGPLGENLATLYVTPITR